jgi:hypothetical protein
MRGSVFLAATLLGLSAAGGALLTAQNLNLVADGGFASSLAAWHHDPDPNGSSAWSADDASGSAAYWYEAARP